MADEDFEDFGLGDDLEGVVPEKWVDDTYLFELTYVGKFTRDAKEGKPESTSLVLKWTCQDEGQYYGEEIQEWFRIANKAEYEAMDGDEQKKIKDARRRRINRLRSIGVPEAELNTVKRDDILGIRAHLTIKVRPGRDGGNDFVNITNVDLAESVTDSLMGSL